MERYHSVTIIFLIKINYWSEKDINSSLTANLVLKFFFRLDFFNKDTTNLK